MKRLVMDAGPILHLHEAGGLHLLPLGVVLWAAAKSLIGKPEAERLLTGLENSSLWLSPSIRARARVALATIFPAD